MTDASRWTLVNRWQNYGTSTTNAYVGRRRRIRINRNHQHRQTTGHHRRHYSHHHHIIIISDLRMPRLVNNSSATLEWTTDEQQQRTRDTWRMTGSTVWEGTIVAIAMLIAEEEEEAGMLAVSVVANMMITGREADMTTMPMIGGRMGTVEGE
jgi:hypothetical protein